ncbi:MAG: DegT/DnrJ/EryC1/StrS family aminotransferase [Coriobacteriia bacterium]|jgi:aminotransferase EvaB|nr:DegT/DnrJ/EryC1/StrS family aminotransferase [Coriobacteriia bacterium]
MTIRVWEYLTEYAQERDDILDAVDQVFSSGRVILGDSVRRFEEAFSAYCGAAYGVGVDNGTNAIFLGLRALGIEPGDEVITVPNTAVPTVSAIVTAGAIPRFVDIDPATYLMDVEQLESAITERTKCVLPVHLYGQCAAMEEIAGVADMHGVYVLEDCAQAHGARHNGRTAGAMGHASAFSFYPTKILGTYGDAGMVVTSDADVASKLRRLRFYGMKQSYYSEEHGYNSRLDEVHAEILNRKLTRLDEYLAARRKIARRYDERLKNLPLGLPQVAAGNEHSYYLYVVRTANRDSLLNELAQRDIQLSVSYPWPIHTMRGYASLGYRAGDFPNAERAAAEVLSLPMYPTLAEQDQERVCDVLAELLS